MVSIVLTRDLVEHHPDLIDIFQYSNLPPHGRRCSPGDNVFAGENAYCAFVLLDLKRALGG